MDCQEFWDIYSLCPEDDTYFCDPLTFHHQVNFLISSVLWLMIKYLLTAERQGYCIVFHLGWHSIYHYGTDVLEVMCFSSIFQFKQGSTAIGCTHKRSAQLQFKFSTFEVSAHRSLSERTLTQKWRMNPFTHCLNDFSAEITQLKMLAMASAGFWGCNCFKFFVSKTNLQCISKYYS